MCVLIGQVANTDISVLIKTVLSVAFDSSNVSLVGLTMTSINSSLILNEFFPA